MDFPRDYLGLPFRDHGRGRDGIDCYGLIGLIYREQLGITLAEVDYIDAMHAGSVAQAISEQRRHWHGVSDPRAYDVVLLGVAGRPRHVGIVCKPGWMLHILNNGVGSVIDCYLSRCYRERIAGFYRYGA